MLEMRLHCGEASQQCSNVTGDALRLWQNSGHATSLVSHQWVSLFVATHNGCGHNHF